MNDFLNVLNRFDGEVGGERYDVFMCYDLAIPLDGELSLNESWPLYEKLTDDRRIALREGVTHTLAALMLPYSIRMATLAVRRGDTRLPYFGALALTVDDHFLDERDVSCACCVLYDACRRLGVDADATLAEATKYSSGRRRENLEYYYRESPDFMKRLSSMGYQAVGEGEAFCYRFSLL